MFSVAVAPRRWCQSRAPQSWQNQQSRVWPLAVGRDHSFGSPRITPNAACDTCTEIPKAEDDCLRHSVQWQT